MIIYTKKYKVNQRKKLDKARRENMASSIPDRKAFLDNLRTVEKSKYETAIASLPVNKISSFFGISGVYFLYKGDKLVYIGESSCIITRLMQHQEKEFDSFRYILERDEVARLKLEKKYIQKHAPPYNVIHNPLINTQKARVRYKKDLSQLNFD